jgi:hypothetical protein
MPVAGLVPAVALGDHLGGHLAEAAEQRLGEGAGARQGLFGRRRDDALEVLDAVRARGPVGVAVGDHRDRSLRPGCRGLGEGLGQRPLGGAHDGLELGGRLGGRVDRVDLHGVHRAERHQRLALAVEEVTALAEGALEPELLADREVGVPGRPLRGRRDLPAVAVRGDGDRHGIRPRHATGQRPGHVERAGRGVAVAHDGARGDLDRRVAEVLDGRRERRLGGVVGKGNGREVLGGPGLRIGGDRGSGGVVAVGLALPPPQRTADAHGDHQDGGDDQCDARPHGGQSTTRTGSQRSPSRRS